MRRRSPQARRRRYVPSLAVILASLLAAAVLSLSKGPLPSQGPERAVPASTLRVVQVYDGDTIRLSNGEKVRLIGIDTPELHESPKLRRDVQRTGQDAATVRRMGKRAREFTDALVFGRDVRVQTDLQERDKYGRLLAYVYLGDGTFVNEEIIKNGYATPMSIPPNVRYAEDFRGLYEQAREEKKGLWGKAP
ncbi:MAG: thermonuclease [Elusimicrobia bacterium]|nr:thermonuclease [Elusimicrobiota bacterium]